MLGLAAQLQGKDADQVAAARRVRNWLETEPELGEQWRRIEEGRRVELGRLSYSPFDRYSGILSQPICWAKPSGVWAGAASGAHRS